MADSLQVLATLFNLGSGFLLVAVAGFLWFTPPGNAPKRLLALGLALLGFSLFAGLLQPPQRIPGVLQANDRFYNHVTFASNLAILGFLATYPSPPRLRSVHGLVLGAALLMLLVPAVAWLWDPWLLYFRIEGPLGPEARRTLLGRLGLIEGVPFSHALGLASAVVRAGALPDAPRRSALVLLAIVGPVGIVAGWAVEAARFLAGVDGLLSFYLVALPQVQGDCCGFSWLLVAGSALVPAGVAAYASRRLRSHALWWVVAFYLVLSVLYHTVPGGFALLQYPAVALGVLYAVRRRGALEVPSLPPWAAATVTTTMFVLVFFGAALLVLVLAGESAVVIAVAVLVGLVAGAGAAYGTHPGRDWLFGSPPGGDTSVARLGPYRAALVAELAQGTTSDDISTKLRGLRAELGVSEHEHAVLEYALRGTAAGGAPVRLDAGALFLGRYRVERLLGRGGAGTTYLCRDERVGRAVVLKKYRGEGPGGVREVLREARAIGAVHHDNVVTLYDVEQVGDEALIVMEHLPGGTLADRLRAGPLPAPAFAGLARDLLDALAAVHAAGAVHRDVKPSNVLQTLEGRAKLADFGVAHLPGFETTEAGLAGGGAAVGTVRYMSPEQAKGRRSDARGDLFSAAATLYEALAGRPYLDVVPGESAVEAQMRAAAAGPFDKPFPPAGPLRDWFARALDPDPARRYPSARAMREAFDGAWAASTVWGSTPP